MKSFWHGKQLSSMHLACINSFLNLDIQYEIYTYSDISNIPDGVIVSDANEILKESFLFYDSKNSLASFSDLFRYSLLFLKGGVWVDIDFYCLPKFKTLSLDFPFFASEKTLSGDFIISNFIIYFSADHPIMLHLVQNCLRMLNELEVIPWGDFGSNLIYKVLDNYNLDCHVFNPLNFAPLNWFDLYDFNNKIKNLNWSKSYGIHLWNEVWSKENISIESFISKLNSGI
ncbi:capsular polysaccharide synthesis protein [Algoriphagus pacificus]|uniref:Glycosyltransferase sugar-binding region containing DXD motif-containing protein n=1 Tax=Algoriphagus pacificus TaxID=2811234 RepID=A0ABS3CQ59_9BACT|nr:capsular polysaccharide synthesis protein [Algoriphagus pacificus]MBN7817794.1 hypothetical protein [Algoriphagus pacificus]